MAEERVQRRLAAILAADVVGYSRLMDADEAGTLLRLKAVRSEIFDPKIEAYGGRVFKNTGDGAMADFGSSVDAVQCAVEVQRALAERNAEAAENQRIIMRIGISQGDVIIDGDDLFGNGVNVAARMEGLAEPGGICVSGNVREHIGNSLDVTLEDLGEQTVKNIDRPVWCYRVRLEEPVVGVEPPPPLPDKPSIAVLPFENMSGDPEQEYFADGITEDIITGLSRIREIFVIARNTTFTYKGSAVDVQAIAKDLGVQYVLEGSVRKGGSRVRITAQLIDGETANHLWAERYDRQLDDIFDLQDDITATIVGALQPELGRAERERAHAKRTHDLNSWDAYQRGMWYTYRRTKAELATALKFFQQAIDMDPNFAPAHRGAAICIFYAVIWGWAEDRKALLDEALGFAQRSLELDPDDSMAHTAMGYVRIARFEHGDAIPFCQRAIELDPNNYHAPRMLGFALTGLGQAAEALPYLHQSVRMSPRDPLVSGTLAWLAAAYLFEGDLDLAADFGRQALRARQAPQTWVITTPLSIFGYLGLHEEAKRTRAELLRLQPDITCAFVRANIPISHPEYLELYIEGLRKAGLPE